MAREQRSYGGGSRAKEKRLIDLIDKADTIRRFEKEISKMWSGATDPIGYFKAVSADAALNLTHLMLEGESEKTKLDATKEILDRAGYASTTKVAFSGGVRVDHDTSRAELINMILSSAKKNGIKVKEDPPELLPISLPGQVIDAESTVINPVELDESSEEDDECD